MASPKFDELHARLSRQLNDPVAAGSASSDGDVLSSADRSDYLNRATKEFLSDAYLILGAIMMRKVFQSMLTSQAIAAFSSSGVSVGSDYIELPIDLHRTGYTRKFILWSNKDELDDDVNPILDAAYVVQGGKVYAYYDGTILNSGAGVFYYIGYTDLTAAHATLDTALPVIFYDFVVDIAANYFYQDTTGKLDEGRLVRRKAAMDFVKQIAGA